MKSSLLSILMLAIAAAPLAAGTTLEGLKGRGAVAFQDLAKFKLRKLSRRTVGVSGNVRLSGMTHVPDNTSWAHVNLSGYTTISGDGGKVSSGNVSVRVSKSIFLSGGSNHVSENIYISDYVTFYRDGKSIGSGRVSGSIWVTGWKNGSWLDLSGSGSLSGSISFDVEDPAKKK